jgi:lipoprotein-releasing system permease protein
LNLPLFIAKRYLISKKKQNIINIISGISIAGIVVGAMAIIIVVSVLNGFNKLMEQFYSTFDPDIKITSVEGKMFDPKTFDVKKIKALSNVVHYAEVIEEMALLKYGNQIIPATVKGVPENYSQYTNIDSLIVDGEYLFRKDGINYAVVGRGVAINLGIGLSFIEDLMIYAPKTGRQVSINPARNFNNNYVFPSGIFSILEEIDAKYILVSYDYAAKLFETKGRISSIELGISPFADVNKVQKEIKNILGEGFHVKNQQEQHDLVFKTMKSEKWVTFLILFFILVLASVNMIGNLTILFIDKKEDILILQSMGATIRQIRRIFLFEGWLISLLGAIIGTILGIFVCWIQIKFAIITFPGSAGSFIISGYPVQLIFSDIILAFSTVIFIGFVVSWYPLKFISNKYLLNTGA